MLGQGAQKYNDSIKLW